MAKDTHTHERIAVQKWFHRKNTSCSGILLLTLLVIALLNAMPDFFMPNNMASSRRMTNATNEQGPSSTETECSDAGENCCYAQNGKLNWCGHNYCPKKNNIFGLIGRPSCIDLICSNGTVWQEEQEQCIFYVESGPSTSSPSSTSSTSSPSSTSSTSSSSSNSNSNTTRNSKDDSSVDSSSAEPSPSSQKTPNSESTSASLDCMVALAMLVNYQLLNDLV